MRIMLVAGARPNFVKVASLIDAIHAYNQTAASPLDYLLVHTGQHYDEQMAQAFFTDLRLPRPQVHLAVGSASHACQTADVMRRIEPVILREQPDAVVVVGDVNSTLAGALVAAKVAYPHALPASDRTRPLLAHVEAGLRSFDRSMPEEINRILTDVLSDLLFITEDSARENLLREGIPGERIHLVGNTMVDTLLKHRDRARNSPLLVRLGLRKEHVSGCRNYAVVTLHRPGNVDHPDTLREILAALVTIAKELPLFFPVHPRTLNRIRALGLEDSFHSGPQPSGIHALAPLGYVDFLCLLSQAKLVLTDSGGLQEETSVLGIPCVTLRQNTERPVTLTHGTNVLAGISKEDIIHHAFRQLRRPVQPRKPPLWDGEAGKRTIEILARYLAESALSARK